MILLILFLFLTSVCTGNTDSSSQRLDDCFTTPLSNFDGPQIVNGNATSFEWWYFDAVSSDGKSGVTIVFYRTGVAGIHDPLDYVEISLVEPNGSIFTDSFAANSSNVTACGYGASGVWNAAGASFQGTPDLRLYNITLDNNIIKGSMTILSTTPGRYPGGQPPGSNASALAAPEIFWTNAIPSGIANANFKYKGQTLKISNGTGYHDHNWGGLGLAAGLASWYWGHATVGEYTLVWFDSITSTNVRHGSTYLVQSGEVLLYGQHSPFASASNFATILPFGNGTVFPANMSSGRLPSGFILTFVGTSGRHWSFLAEHVYIAENVAGLSLYTRWIGKVTGGEVGGPMDIGSGVWEWLRF